MPKLWNDTIESHKQAVREATLDAVAAIVAEGGLSSVTMSRIAEEAGIGRATLYKYFADVQQTLSAWHEREIGRHLRELEAARDNAGNALSALQQVLETYARVGPHRHREDTLAGFLHDQHHSNQAHNRLHKLLSDLITEAAANGEVRSDVPAGELTHYCLSALSASRHLGSATAIKRIVNVILDGLRSASR
jgi:AcrR family transcriptional regulator